MRGKSVLGLVLENAREPFASVVLVERRETHMGVERLVPRNLAEGGQSQGVELVTAGVIDGRLDQGATGAFSLMIMPDGQFPDVEFVATGFSAEESKGPIRSIDNHPRGAGASIGSMLLNRLNIVIGDPGQLRNIAKSLPGRPFNLGQ